MKHATITLGDFNVPLIGIPENATLETCDLCGDLFSIQSVELTGKQILCNKCNDTTQHSTIPACERKTWQQ